MCLWNVESDTPLLLLLETWESRFTLFFCQKLLAVRNWSGLSHVWTDVDLSCQTPSLTKTGNIYKNKKLAGLVKQHEKQNTKEQIENLSNLYHITNFLALNKNLAVGIRDIAAHDIWLWGGRRWKHRREGISLCQTDDLHSTQASEPRQLLTLNSSPSFFPERVEAITWSALILHHHSHSCLLWSYPPSCLVQWRSGPSTDCSQPLWSPSDLSILRTISCWFSFFPVSLTCCSHCLLFIISCHSSLKTHPRWPWSPPVKTTTSTNNPLCMLVLFWVLPEMEPIKIYWYIVV